TPARPARRIAPVIRTIRAAMPRKRIILAPRMRGTKVNTSPRGSGGRGGGGHSGERGGITAPTPTLPRERERESIGRSAPVIRTIRAPGRLPLRATRGEAGRGAWRIEPQHARAVHLPQPVRPRRQAEAL